MRELARATSKSLTPSDSLWAQDTCLVCPAGKTNVEVGATNEDQCKGRAIIPTFIQCMFN